MAESRTGRVISIAINDHKLSFALASHRNERFVLYDEAANTQTIPQFELATRSWMLALLQTAFTSTRELIVNYNDNREKTNYVVNQVELHDPLHIAPLGPTSPIATPIGQTPIVPKGKGE